MSDANQRNVETLRRLSALPSLTKLSTKLEAADLQRLLEQRGFEQAVTELGAAFPSRLRSLSLLLCHEQSAALAQLQVDALPAALQGLTELELVAGSGDEAAFASLSLEPLLQLPRLAKLTLNVDDATVTAPHFPVIKQMAALRELMVAVQWNVERLAALCRPPHRLQQLQRLDLLGVDVDEAEMAELIHLPSLTMLMSQWLLPSAYPFLVRLPLLQDLHVSVEDYASPSISEAQRQMMDDGLKRCPSLTRVHMRTGTVTNADGTRLVRSLPHLRALHFTLVPLPSLRFLQHAPQLDQLNFSFCDGMRPAHLTSLGQALPNLTDLCVWCCDGLRLDVSQRRALTPPSRLLPNLRNFECLAQ